MAANHPNRNWRKKWRVIDGDTAYHEESELQVKFDADGKGKIIASPHLNFLDVDEAIELSRKYTKLLLQSKDVYKERIANNDA